MEYQTVQPLTRAQLEDCLSKTQNARVGLIGDLCLDMYWLADMTQSQLSRETPHFPLPVVQERYAPGGAGNVACNMAALKPGSLKVFGVVGCDWRGELLLRSLREQGISTENILQDPSLITNTYIKPLRKGISQVVYEDPRLDFENRVPLGAETEEKLMAALKQEAKNLDVLCVSDQMEYGCITPRVRQLLCDLGKAGLTVIVDSRSRVGLYTQVICKPNEVEAANLFGKTITTLRSAGDACAALSRQTGKASVVTLGDQGSMLCTDGQCLHIPACPVEPPVDFCGAGDTYLSGFGTFLAAGAQPHTAAQIATLCSAVTIKKLKTTGTASPQELLQLFDSL